MVKGKKTERENRMSNEKQRDRAQKNNETEIESICCNVQQGRGKKDMQR